ncbi:hypothetical protein D7X94_16595 [Acutalibacter sp. 1XD8-33]|uniref:hypothetical protein n=1 Tax=Acutalibacter sp. 1XD8-33 TaxID=2320081 RepID=UPI000EA13A09|nr:hypothetical protein [Acutalibacter sp. 1XD8-33]RKJ38382.1 hypothetical protein D7X94_16595 [Acutalibacter sp. 1XD8-33]
MNTTNNKISVKETAFGQDMLEVLIEKQLQQAKFRELDVPQAIKTMKSHLVSKFAPQKGEYPSKLRFMYPTYFDSARVLVAEYVAEFFLTGKIAFSELNTNSWEYIDHEIRQIVLTETEADMLLRVLRKVQKPDHDMCSRWENPADRERWKAHIQAVYNVISQL